MSYFMQINFILTFFTYLLLCTNILYGQNGAITGLVKVDGTLQEFATVSVSTKPVIGAVSNTRGYFILQDLPNGTYTLTASFVGYKKQIQTITLNKNAKTIDVVFNLNEPINTLNEIVVTGTKTYKRQTDSPVIVNLINSQTLNNVQACNLSEGLKFQPGLRVETNCQTCNYTQLRMNGLGGGYSQILINGRPIFSPLTGLYGLEQLPTNMIDRIEVVRGGGSSLYGSSAIGGTVNVITKVPKKNAYELTSFYQNINGKTNDVVVSGNSSLVSENNNSGVSFFFNHRARDLYDHNKDGFSEIPKIENNSFGANVFFLPNEDQKIEFNLSNLNEFRSGGELSDKPAYLTAQAEERTHQVRMGSADYQITKENTSLITYAAWQNTKRKHYTGIFPDEELAIQSHLENPPYGTSNTTTLQGGFQLNHKKYNFLKGTNTFTLGSEYVIDDVFDEIESYNYSIDQRTTDLGLFVQSDWNLSRSINLLSGVRMDKHNLINGLVFSPRYSLLYKHKANTQFRINYGTGFRAPQAFDTDLHMAFAGGGISRVNLSPELRPEKSQSFSTSVNYDKPSEHFIAGFTIEAFYTRLEDAFYLQPIGQDNFGSLFEKQNGQGATVQGITLELRANYDKKVQLETGFTLQSSKFDEKVSYIDGLEGLKDFVRTPSNYGFATLTITPNSKINANLNYIYTGEMKVPHFAGAPNQTIDEMSTSKPFSELSAKIAYTFTYVKMQSAIEIYGGVKNLFNSYQSNFDIGKNRDSNYVFGPSLPRTFFIGVKLKKQP